SAAAGLLRLPGGALAAPADDQRDRERVRDRAVADGEDQGVGDARGVPDDGVQADAIGLAPLASAQRLGAAGGGDQGDGVRGWDQERGRRLTNSSSTTIDNTPWGSGTIRVSVVASIMVAYSCAALARWWTFDTPEYAAFSHPALHTIRKRPVGPVFVPVIPFGTWSFFPLSRRSCPCRTASPAIPARKSTGDDWSSAGEAADCPSAPSANGTASPSRPSTPG